MNQPQVSQMIAAFRARLPILNFYEVIQFGCVRWLCFSRYSLFWKEIRDFDFEGRCQRSETSGPSIIYLRFHDLSTRAINKEAGTPRASLNRKRVSSVGDIRLFSRRLRKVRSTSASKANCSWVMPAFSRAFLRISPNMLANFLAWQLDCLSLISYKICWSCP